MNRNFTLLTALAAGFIAAPVLSASSASAQAAPAATSAPAPIPAKIALVNFEQVVLASNEGQTVTLATQKKYEPKKTDIEKLAAEVDSLKKGLQAGTTLTDDDRAKRLRDIDTKEKQLNRDAEDAQTAYNAEWQEALGKVAAKLAVTMRSYAQANGYTILLDVSSQQNNVLWTSPTANQDISQAVVDAYNKSSGVAAPAPSAPSAGARTAPRPATRPSASPATRPAPKP